MLVPIRSFRPVKHSRIRTATNRVRYRRMYDSIIINSSHLTIMSPAPDLEYLSHPPRACSKVSQLQRGAPQRHKQNDRSPPRPS